MGRGGWRCFFFFYSPPSSPTPHRPAPYDALVDDGTLSADALAAARASGATWAAEGAVALLPYSCVVLESVPEDDASSPPRPMTPDEQAAHEAAVTENERLRAQIAALEGES